VAGEEAGKQKIQRQRVPEGEETPYTRLFSERVRIPLIAKGLGNTLCEKTEKIDGRVQPEEENFK